MPEGQIHRLEILIRENYLDSFGHMNNAAFLQIFEQARWEVLSHGGVGLKHIQKIQEGPVVLGVQVQFKREVSLREQLTVESRVLSLEKKIYILEQQMFDRDRVLRCRAEFTMGYFDMKRRKLLLPPADWMKILGWSA